jgi:hypothetical protein
MFKPLLTLTITAAIIMVTSSAFAASTTFNLSVTIPPHTMPTQATMNGQEQQILTAPQITREQVTQQQQITRNNSEITVQSTVVL